MCTDCYSYPYQVSKKSELELLKQKEKAKDDVHTIMTETHRGELVLTDLPQDRIYGFVPNGNGQSIKITR